MLSIVTSKHITIFSELIFWNIFKEIILYFFNTASSKSCTRCKLYLSLIIIWPDFNLFIIKELLINFSFILGEPNSLYAKLRISSKLSLYSLKKCPVLNWNLSKTKIFDLFLMSCYFD